MSITVTQARNELAYRAVPKKEREPRDFEPGEAFGASSATLQAIVAKAPAKKAPAKAPAKKAPKAPKAKAPRKNPEANDAFQAELAAGNGLRAAHRAFARKMAELAEAAK